MYTAARRVYGKRASIRGSRQQKCLPQWSLRWHARLSDTTEGLSVAIPAWAEGG